MSPQGKGSIDSISEEVLKIKELINNYVKVDKAGRVFFVIGLFFIVLGGLILNFVFDLNLSLPVFFLVGLSLSVIFLIGYSLMHKSLRGAWL